MRTFVSIRRRKSGARAAAAAAAAVDRVSFAKRFVASARVEGVK